MSHGKQARILSVDDSGALHEVLRAAVGGSGGVPPLSLTPARLAEALAIARLERASDQPYSLAFLALPQFAALAAVEAAAQLAAEDGDLQLVLCPAADGPSVADSLWSRFGGSDRVVLLRQPFAADEALQLIRSLAAKAELQRELRAAKASTATLNRDRFAAQTAAKSGFEQEAQFERALMDTFLLSVPDAVYFKDLESRFVRASISLAHRVGHDDPNEIVGLSDLDLFSEEHGLQAFADEQEVIRTGQPLLGKIEKETLPDGRSTWVLTSKLPWRNPAGAIIGTFGISKDITALKRAEEDLQNASDMLQALLDNIPDRIYYKNAQSRFTKVGKALVKRLGMTSPDQVIGKTDFDFHPPELARQFVHDEEHIMATGEAIIAKVEQQVGPEGEPIWASVTKVPIYDRIGQIAGIIGISRDITALKLAEQELQQKSRELIETSRAAGMAEVATGVLHNVGNVLNSVNVAATLVSDMVRRSKAVNLARLAAMLKSHGQDLSAFLTQDEKGRQIPGYLEQLGKHLADEQQTLLRELDEMRKSVDHIRDIVATQQGYAKVGGTIEPVIVADLVEMALRMQLTALTRHDVTVNRQFSPVPTVVAEKHKVLQILNNLIRNAKQALEANLDDQKLLTVRLAPNGRGGVSVQVLDNGMGIAPENLTKIFAHSFSTRPGGHGFGLHSAALAAKEMGGSLTVHSEGVGKGAMFSLDLPAQPKEDKKS
ncbi:MAG: PAS domain-containing protein [Verrucomicrobia bacterium]|nr:PAS domain-containing protein [Verrucomicrobiota bacterium]